MVAVAATEAVRTSARVPNSFPPASLQTSAVTAVSSANCVVLTAVCDDDSSAWTTPGVKSGDVVEGRAPVGSADGGGSGGGDGNGFSGDGGGGLAGGKVVGGGCGVVE